MKSRFKNHFLLKTTNTEHIKNNKEKFELVSCPQNEKYCHKIRPNLNKNYLNSELNFINKEYQKSIELLKDAHQKTFELKEPSCANCAEFFRLTIAQSLINLQKEIRMSKRIFSSKGYQLASLNLDPVLKEI